MSYITCSDSVNRTVNEQNIWRPRHPTSFVGILMMILNRRKHVLNATRDDLPSVTDTWVSWKSEEKNVRLHLQPVEWVKHAYFEVKNHTYSCLNLSSSVKNASGQAIANALNQYGMPTTLDHLLWYLGRHKRRTARAEAQTTNASRFAAFKVDDPASWIVPVSTTLSSLVISRGRAGKLSAPTLQLATSISAPVYGRHRVNYFADEFTRERSRVACLMCPK